MIFIRVAIKLQTAFFTTFILVAISVAWLKLSEGRPYRLSRRETIEFAVIVAILTVLVALAGDGGGVR